MNSSAELTEVSSPFHIYKLQLENVHLLEGKQAGILTFLVFIPIMRKIISDDSDPTASLLRDLPACTPNYIQTLMLQKGQ